MSDDLANRLATWGASAALDRHFMGTISARETCAAAATELTRLRMKDYASDNLAEVYWRLRGYAVHDDDCTVNRHPHYRGCSCGLKDALDKGEATIRVFQPAPAEPTEYEIKLAQMKKDFPNGI